MRWISKFRTLFSGRPVGALFAITKRQVFLRGDRKSGSSEYLRTGVVGQDEVLKQLLSSTFAVFWRHFSDENTFQTNRTPPYIRWC